MKVVSLILWMEVSVLDGKSISTYGKNILSLLFYYKTDTYLT